MRFDLQSVAVLALALADCVEAGPLRRDGRVLRRGDGTAETPLPLTSTAAAGTPERPASTPRPSLVTLSSSIKMDREMLIQTSSSSTFTGIQVIPVSRHTGTTGLTSTSTPPAQNADPSSTALTNINTSPTATGAIGTKPVTTDVSSAPVASTSPGTQKSLPVTTTNSVVHSISRSSPGGIDIPSDLTVPGTKTDQTSSPTGTASSASTNPTTSPTSPASSSATGPETTKKASSTGTLAVIPTNGTTTSGVTSPGSTPVTSSSARVVTTSPLTTSKTSETDSETSPTESSSSTTTTPTLATETSSTPTPAPTTTSTASGNIKTTTTTTPVATSPKETPTTGDKSTSIPQTSKKSPTTTEAVPTPTVTPIGTPNPGVPTVIASAPPKGTSPVKPDVFQNNLKQAKSYNEMFQKLTPTSACNSKQAACVNGKQAICNVMGSFELIACASGQKCFALPIKDYDGIVVGCHDAADAERILGVGASQPPATNQPTTTVAQPTTTKIVPASSKTESPKASPTTTVALTTSSPEPTTVITLTTTSIVYATVPMPASSEAAFTSPQSVRPPISVSGNPATPVTTLPVAEPPATTQRSIFTQSIKIPTKNPNPQVTIISPDQDPDTIPKPNPTSMLLIIGGNRPKPTVADVPGAGGAADAGLSRTTQIVNGVPTVSVTKTVTTTERETVTATKTERETVTFGIILPSGRI